MGRVVCYIQDKLYCVFFPFLLHRPERKMRQNAVMSMRIKETNRLKYQRLLKNHKDKTHITEVEQTLNSFNSKSCNLDKFKEYIAKKLEVNEVVVPL